jgi:hypothetical protein
MGSHDFSPSARLWITAQHLYKFNTGGLRMSSESIRQDAGASKKKDATAIDYKLEIDWSSWIALVIVIIAVWGLEIIYAGVILLFIASIIYLVRGALGHLALLLLLSPIGLGAYLALDAYANCKLVLINGTPPEGMITGIDPETRCPYGRMLGGFQPLTIQVGRECTVAMLLTLFGPMKGSYDGPYPLPGQQASALNSGTELSLETFRSGTFDVDGVTVHLGSELATGLLTRNGSDYFKMLYHPAEPNDHRPYGPIKAAIFEKRCLIIRTPLERGPDSNARKVLIDLATMKPFAYFDGRTRPFVDPNAVPIPIKYPFTGA